MNEHPSREYIRQINGLKILINEDLNDDEIMVSPGVYKKMKEKNDYFTIDNVLDIMNELSEREERLLSEIDDFQDLLSKNDNVCHDRVINLIDEKIAVLTDAKIKSFQNEDEELFMKIKFSIQILRELKEVIE